MTGSPSGRQLAASVRSASRRRDRRGVEAFEGDAIAQAAFDAACAQKADPRAMLLVV